MQIQLLAVCSVFAVEICEHLTMRTQAKLADAGTTKLMILVQFSEFAVDMPVPLAFGGPSFVETRFNSSRRRRPCGKRLLAHAPPCRVLFCSLPAVLLNPRGSPTRARNDRWCYGNPAVRHDSNSLLGSIRASNDASADFVLGKMRHGEISTSGSV